ncbi:hypothetical protein HU200_035928 [Digitaria exilis]|uniref:RRM domain-containing protein n=1 Tax=Digitaria exilis TaxID=1010633 RepID=A0A835BHE0_9POAL|nr:hypothetical protein HU200_035928 [Digitaria exilis]
MELQARLLQRDAAVRGRLLQRVAQGLHVRWFCTNVYLLNLHRSQDDRNPGNNLYVTGLSTRVTEDDLEKFFSKEGKVKHCHVVLDPRTKESRGFAFVTMDTVDDARRCIKYLHRTINSAIICDVVCKPSVVTGEKPLVWLFNWGLNSSCADFLTFQFNVVLGCLDVNLVGSGCAVFDHGCRQGMCS